MQHKPRHGLFHRRLAALGALILMAFVMQGAYQEAALNAAEPKFKQYFVSVSGRPNGDGSKQHPWDLVTALAQPKSVQPGDTLWLRGGIYGHGNTVFVSKLTGTAENPIVVKPFPGERATINGGLMVKGPYTWYWGFEIMSSLPDRGPQRGAPDGIGAYDGSAHTKFINLVIHDTNQGIGLWEGAQEAEVYGCLIYHNGYLDSDRGHGHGIYTQNREGIKHLVDNIIFGQFGWGLHAYGSPKAFVEGYDVRGNISFNNGDLSGAYNDNILFAGIAGMRRIRLEENYTYYSGHSVSGGMSRLGDNWTNNNHDIVVLNNYWIGGQPALTMANWSHITFAHNTVFSRDPLLLFVSPPTANTRYDWNANSYFGPGVLRYAGQNRSWDDWKTVTGFDTSSRHTTKSPHGLWTFVRGNKYEPGRANIVVYNWDHLSSVQVDASSVLKKGDHYVIHDAQDFFGNPVASGKYQGSAITIPMTALTRVAPIGVSTVPKHTAPEFAVFILQLK